MEIITQGEQIQFSPEIAKRRGFIRAKHITWPNFRNGLITFASPILLQSLFLTGVNASASYYTIRASEVANGEWDIILSYDLKDIYETTTADSCDLVTAVRKLFKEETGNEGC